MTSHKHAKHRFLKRTQAEFNEALGTIACGIEMNLIYALHEIEQDASKSSANAAHCTRLLISRKELQEVLGEKAYRNAAKEYFATTEMYLSRHQDIINARVAHPQFYGSDPARVRILKDAMTREFTGLDDRQTRIIGYQLDLMVLLGRSVREAAEAIAEELDDEFKPNAEMYAGTALAIYDRLVSAKAYPVEDDSKYLYAGPNDDLCRPFCKQRAGKIFSISEILAMDNGQLSDVFLTCGGYNCRHQWLPLPSDEYNKPVT